jgi:hypothetical protein
VGGSASALAIPTPGQGEYPPRPQASQAQKRYVQRWLDETADTEEFRDAVRQYESDLSVLHPSDERWNWGRRDRHSHRTGPSGRPWRGAKASRREDRNVEVARVFRSAQQTLAMVCPYDFGVRWTERPMVRAPDGMFHQDKGDVWLRQFAATLSSIVDIYGDEIHLNRIIRSWVFQAIQFRVGILKVGFSRNWYEDPLSSMRPSDEQESMARLQYLGERLLRGEINEQSAEAEEIKGLIAGLMAGGMVEVSQQLTATTIPLTRFKCDGQVSSPEELAGARWMGEDFLMTRAQIEERFPFSWKDDGTWEGVHPQDFATSTTAVYDIRGRRISDENRAELQREANHRRGRNRAEDLPADDNYLYVVKEIWSRLEGKTLWLMEGIDYTIGEQIYTTRSKYWFPYRIMGMNPREGTWYSLSDTELAGPIQNRQNLKLTDENKSRWFAMGRGIYNTQLIDEQEAIKLGTLEPGKLKGINLGGAKIQDVIMWLQSPHDPKWFDIRQDEEDMRFILRQPEQQLGVTDAKTTATAINTANTGTQIASSDKANLVKNGIGDVFGDIAEVLVQELRPDEVMQECGPNAVWPKIFDERTAGQLKQQIFDQVTEEVTQAVEQQLAAALMAGQPPQISEPQIDAMIAQRRHQLMVQEFGAPEPMTRESLYRRLQVSVKVSMNGRADQQQRIQQLVAVLKELTGLGMTRADFNLEPLARLVMHLMGEDDDAESIFKPDANALIAAVAQIAQTNPQSISPEAAQVLAGLGGLAMRFLASNGMLPSGGRGPGPGAPPANPGHPAPAHAPTPAPAAAAPGGAAPPHPTTAPAAPPH